jgi:hypothetical protein
MEKKSSNFGGPIHSSIPALPGLEPIKKIIFNYLIHSWIAKLVSGFKDNEDKPNIVFFSKR